MSLLPSVACADAALTVEAMTRPVLRDGVYWLPAHMFEPFLEHDGLINDEEYGSPGAHLALLADQGASFSAQDPLVLAVFPDPDGSLRASVFDGNHRLILVLAEDRNCLVPYRVDREVFSTHPGFPCDDWFSPRPQAKARTPRTRASGISQSR